MGAQADPPNVCRREARTPIRASGILEFVDDKGLYEQHVFVSALMKAVAYQ